MRITQKEKGGIIFSKTEANHWGHTKAMVKNTFANFSQSLP